MSFAEKTMTETQIRKRNTSFFILLGCLGLDLVNVVCVPYLVPIRKGSIALSLMMGVLYILMAAKAILWFKGFYHWSKALGYSGGLALIGLLGFPIGAIVMACLKDKCPAPPPIGDPIQSCPACGKTYRLGEYNKDAEHIFCTGCKGELTKG